MTNLLLQALHAMALLGACQGPEPGPAAQDATARKQERPGIDPRLVDELMSGYSGLQPGAACLIARGDELLIAKGYGLAVVDPPIEVVADTRFRIASVSKMFTATAILLLVEEGRLELDTQLQAVFPQFPAYGAGISIRQLLTHTSGLPGYGDLINATTDGSQLLDNDVLNYLMTLKAGASAPGTEFSYSNAAYSVLAEVVAQVSGQPFDRFMTERIFAPLAMETTGYLDPANPFPDRAIGYRLEPEGPVVSDQTQATAIRGDGSIYTTANDLFRWHLALIGSEAVEGGLLTSELLRESMTPQPGTNDGYGYGWFVPEDTGDVGVYHGGSTYGFIAYLRHLPEQDITVVVVGNRDYTAIQEERHELDRLTLGLLSLATEGEVPMPTFAPASPR